jgi:hypothetical protein
MLEGIETETPDAPLLELGEVAPKNELLCDPNLTQVASQAGKHSPKN